MSIEGQVREEATQGKCCVCGGVIVKRYVYKFTSRYPPIIGPASKQQFSWSFDGYHCQDCGIMYNFVPPASLQSLPDPQELEEWDDKDFR
jgi:hypothetical protein